MRLNRRLTIITNSKVEKLQHYTVLKHVNMVSFSVLIPYRTFIVSLKALGILLGIPKFWHYYCCHSEPLFGKIRVT